MGVWATAPRHLRLQRRQRMRDRGVTPCRRTMIYRVDLDRLTVPEWARRSAKAGFTIGDRHVWLTRFQAKKLAACEAQVGGRARLTETEYRHCEICGRVLIGEDASARRLRNESSMTGRQVPCGPDCLSRARGKQRAHEL